jgi:hypothetical protein
VGLVGETSVSSTLNDPPHNARARRRVLPDRGALTGGELLARARAGLRAWQRGNFDALEEVLAPEVELLWWEPGAWDCHGRGNDAFPRSSRLAAAPGGAVAAGNDIIDNTGGLDRAFIPLLGT